MNTQLTMYVDANWGNKFEKSGRSRSGMLVLPGEAVISATTSLQRTMSLSSIETKYITIAEATKTILLLRNALEELAVPQQASVANQENKWLHRMGNRRITQAP